MTKLDELIERLEKATGPDRDLDFSIAHAARWRPQNIESKQSFEEHEAKHGYETAWVAHAPYRLRWNVPSYTASIDAAMMLIEPNEKMSVLQEVLEIVAQRGWHVERFESYVACEVCATALRARKAQETGE